MARRKLPDPKKYKRLYDTKRFIVFLNNKEEPFEEWSDGNELVLWDKLYEGTIGVANFKPDGTIYGEALAGQGVTFDAKDIREMVKVVNSIYGILCK